MGGGRPRENGRVAISLLSQNRQDAQGVQEAQRVVEDGWEDNCLGADVPVEYYYYCRFVQLVTSLGLRWGALPAGG